MWLVAIVSVQSRVLQPIVKTLAFIFYLSAFPIILSVSHSRPVSGSLAILFLKLAMQVLASVPLLLLFSLAHFPLRYLSGCLSLTSFITLPAQQLSKRWYHHILSSSCLNTTYNAVLTYTFPTHLIFLYSTYIVFLPPLPIPPVECEF